MKRRCRGNYGTRCLRNGTRIRLDTPRERKLLIREARDNPIFAYMDHRLPWPRKWRGHRQKSRHRQKRGDGLSRWELESLISGTLRRMVRRKLDAALNEAYFPPFISQLTKHSNEL